MRARASRDDAREAMSFDDVDNALYRARKAISVAKFDTARAIAVRFLDQIGVQADLFPDACATMRSIASDPVEYAKQKADRALEQG